MATVLDIVRGISQAAANGYDGSQYENHSYDGEATKIGLKREEGNPILDSRVVDGFGVKFHGNQLCISYQSDIRLKDVYVLVQNTSKVRVFVVGKRYYKIGNLDGVLPESPGSEDRLDKSIRDFISQGKK
jgi:hypothetical protein